MSVKTIAIEGHSGTGKKLMVKAMEGMEIGVDMAKPGTERTVEVLTLDNKVVKMIPREDLKKGSPNLHKGIPIKRHESTFEDTSEAITNTIGRYVNFVGDGLKIGGGIHIREAALSALKEGLGEIPKHNRLDSLLSVHWTQEQAHNLYKLIMKNKYRRPVRDAKSTSKVEILEEHDD